MTNLNSKIRQKENYFCRDIFGFTNHWGQPNTFCFADHRGQLQDVPPWDILFPVGPSHCSGQVSSNDQNKKLVFVQGTDQNVGSCENPTLLQKIPQKKSSAERVEEEGIYDYQWL